MATFGGSIGAVAVSTWDPNVIYVGGGEKTVRGNVSHGYGVYKSLDAGRTWEHKGLSDSHRIPRIRIHPRDPDHVYAAVMGHLSGPNEERGIYRSLDGGDSWEKILFIDDEVGFVDLAMDPSNPRNPVRKCLARDSNAIQYGKWGRRKWDMEIHRWREYMDGNYREG